MPKVKFIRENKEIEVEKGSNLRKTAMKAGIQLYPGPHKYLNCHGLAQCGECRVYIKNGMEQTNRPNILEKARVRFSFFRIGHEEEVRLACQTEVNGDIEVYTKPEFNWCGQRKK